MRVLATEQVPLERLKTYPGNPNKGDIAAIRASLRRNGQYRAIVVRKRTMHVLAGNHTFLGAREEGWKSMLCHLVTCSEAEAKRIVAADNGTRRGARDDADALGVLLRDLAEDGGLEGTGYEQEDLDRLLGTLPEPGDEPDTAEEQKFWLVLEVDDEPTQRRLLGRFLRRASGAER